MTNTPLYLGIDVGTGSARAGLFDAQGHRLAMAVHPIQMWKEGDFVEQSSENIWQACARCVRKVISEVGVEPATIQGIGFDATCSLVAISGQGEPVTVSPSGDSERNVVVWMDHRATEEATAINAGGHRVLQYVGGRVSPEMQSPKLLWLKKNLPDAWRSTKYYFDLPDYLTYRATGYLARSLCTTVCKWTYMGHEAEAGGGWDDSFWRSIGLADLVDGGYEKIGRNIRPMGEPVGSGLATAAAADFGLKPGIAVSIGIIDAHAGGLGALGTAVDGVTLEGDGVDHRLALIGGTSSCHMAVSAEPRFIPGVWGPYYSAMIPEFWLTEGGQSATGALIDHVINAHARATDLKRQAEATGKSIYQVLNHTLDVMAAELDHPAHLTRDLHVLPYFHGNRSPRADASLRGMVSGLTLDDSVESLARLYLATIQAIAYGTNHIIEEMNRTGYRIDTIVACGGGTKNPVFLREHADITGCKVVLPREPESVLLGSAMLGAVAAGRYTSVMEAMKGMSGAGTVVPSDPTISRYHKAKYEVFHRMYDDWTAYRAMMREA